MLFNIFEKYILETKHWIVTAIKLSILCFVQSIVIGAVIYLIVEYLGIRFIPLDISYLSQKNLFTQVIIAILLAPLIETFIFQKSIHDMFRLFGYSDKSAMFISAFIFGLLHYYSLEQIITSLITGYLFNYTYCYLRYKMNKAAFITISVSHALVNLYVLIVKSML
jgi:membrane protease YdiL (CAAX protease family)